MKRLFILPIRVYQYLISPVLGNNCRHVPSCSQYMVEAINEWGIRKNAEMWTCNILEHIKAGDMDKGGNDGQ
ncbi:membrane protein insertion efficiency factor YidD [Sphingobacterium sp. DN00404]|uniref:Membrane protein insertion efficiency factor YidD n=1 Tax=Sphingobacterium micropteri TaxID=2763501 RepID=A0ABR7YNW6_9SPHI|nr:membrane protein insertion efficiency factor YidD [Sphingobacterium micropteri]MBD1433000.1 membrane protein insertion efficiency factor YidD [Sphingobacterium micropteri]